MTYEFMITYDGQGRFTSAGDPTRCGPAGNDPTPA